MLEDLSFIGKIPLPASLIVFKIKYQKPVIKLFQSWMIMESKKLNLIKKTMNLYNSMDC